MKRIRPLLRTVHAGHARHSPLVRTSAIKTVSIGSCREASSIPNAFKWFRRAPDAVAMRKQSWKDLIEKHKGSRNYAEPVQTDTPFMAFLRTLEDEEIEVIQYKLLTDHGTIDGSGRISVLKELNDRERDHEIPEFLWQSSLLRSIRRALIAMNRDEISLRVMSEVLKPLSENQVLQLELLRIHLLDYLAPKDLVRFLQARLYLTEHGVPETVGIMNIELDLLSTQGHWEEARQLYETMPALGLEPNSGTRGIMLNAAQDIPPGQPGFEERFSFGCELAREIESRDLHDQEAFAQLPYLSWLAFRGDSIEVIMEKVAEIEAVRGAEIGLQEVEFIYFGATLAQRWDFVEHMLSAFQGKVDMGDKYYSYRILAAYEAEDMVLALKVNDEAKAAGFESMLTSEAMRSLIDIQLQEQPPKDKEFLYSLELLGRVGTAPYTPAFLELIIPYMMQQKYFPILEGILDRAKTQSDWDGNRVVKTILAQLPSAQKSDAVWNSFTLLKHLFWDDPLYNLNERFALIQRLVEMDQPRAAGQMFAQFLKSKVQPDVQFYVNMLQGARELRDFELIRRVHQFLQMDLNIVEPSTILNTLMNAYAYVESPLAFDIWQQIYKSGKGPTNASVSIILDACTYTGLHSRGQHIWNMLERDQFVFNDNNYASYVEMLNKCRDTNDAIAVLDKAIDERKAVGIRAISTLYNTGIRKREVVAWATDKCPDLWRQFKRE